MHVNLAAILRTMGMNRKRLIPLLALFLTYLATAKFGAFLYTDLPTYPALIWPPAGIAMVALLIYGTNLWPAVFLASLVGNLSGEYSLTFAFGNALGNTLQAIVGVYVLNRLSFNPMMSRLRDTFGLMLVAIIVTTIVPVVGLISAHLAHIPVTDYLSSGATWWVGEILSIIVLVPFLGRWLAKPSFLRSRREIIEVALAYLALLAIIVPLFFTPYTSLFSVPLVYFMLVPFFWIALRLGPRAMTTALFLTTVLAILGTMFGDLPPAAASIPLGARLLNIELFMIVISAIFLIFSSVVAERQNAVKALQEYIAQLERALQKISSEDRAKNEFLAILAHELRNPLAPVLSSLELIKLQGPAASNTLQLVDIMDDRIRTMGRLLDDLLDITRITRKKLKLQMQPVELQSSIKHALQTTEPAMKSRNHSISVSIPREPIMLYADPVRIEQIFVNLLFNSAKYTEPGGHITITCAKHPQYAEVRVQDTGVGIPFEMLHRIFEPFVQGTPHEKAGAGTGLGIGLSLTKNLVDMHGGNIEALSRGIGRGSEFIVRLPLPDNVDGKHYSDMAHQGPIQKLNKILIVDDNEAAAQGLGKLLEFRGHQVSLAYDGTGCLRMASKVDPEIIILDIGLPDHTGYEIAQKLRKELNYEGALIALTGYGQDEDKVKAMQAGFDFHLTKPVGLADIEAVISQIQHK